MSVKFTVRLFGTFRRLVPDCSPTYSLEMEIPDKGDVSSLLNCLGLSKSDGAVVSMGGFILQEKEKLQNGAVVNVFQAVYGG